MDKKEAKKIVREAYGKIVQGQEIRGCCGSDAKKFAKSIGYSEEELKAIPDEANLALGCGNPTALASLKEGEVVLDLGSGAGFDCFLAASTVGPKGKVIGVDMTPEMIEKARENARKNGICNVEFRLGEIENLPLVDNSVDVVISNCVINLSADKPRVFQDVYRVLKSGGRIAISDIALLKKLPEKIQESIEAYVGCITGAVLIDEYKRIVEASGLKDVRITVKGTSNCILPNTKDPIGRVILDSLGADETLSEYVVSVYVEGNKMINNQNTCCTVDIEKCDTFDFMANVIGLPVLHPGGLKATKELANLCNINKETRVLDIACGKGTNVCYLTEKYGCSVTGIDLDENFIKQARGLAKKKRLEDKLTFKAANAENLPFSDNEFDVSIFQAVLIMVGDQEKALREAIRVTKPNGYIGILELTWKKQPTKEFFEESKNIFCRFFCNAKTSEDWKRLIFNYGLRETTSKTYDMECPCNLRELGILKAIKIFLKQLFNTRIRKRMNDLDNFMGKNEDEYFGYGIYVGQKSGQ